MACHKLPLNLTIGKTVVIIVIRTRLPLLFLIIFAFLSKYFVFLSHMFVGLNNFCSSPYFVKFKLWVFLRKYRAKNFAAICHMSNTIWFKKQAQVESQLIKPKHGSQKS